MTEQEAIEVIKRVYNVSCPDYEDEMLYEEAIELAIKALEKQTPKVVTDTGNEERYEICCPNCNKDLHEKYYRNEKSLYCDECGQALDWGEEE